MKKLVLGSQEKKSHLKGSWPPVNGEIGYGGRSYSTAMACINLEVYYRYLPSYSMPLPSAEPAAGSAAIPPAMATPEELVESLKAKDMMVRRGAFKELVHRRDASSVPALIEATRAETTSARPLMIEDLGAFDGNEAVLEALVAFAKDDDARSREAAFRALKKATGEPFRTADEWAAWWAARKK
jgi:HEAT repeat protein